MTSLAVERSLPAGLPPLSGRLLRAYRFAWAMLVVGCLVALYFSLAVPGHPAVHALRLIKSGAILAVSLILFRRRQRDTVAALLCMAFLTWAISSSFAFAGPALLPLLLDRLRFVLFALALLLFPNGDWHPGWTRPVAAASALTFALGIAEALQLSPTAMFLPLAIACVLLAIGSLVARFRAATSEALRQQLRWVALGLVSGVGLILLARLGGSVSAGVASMRLAIFWEAMFQLGIVAVALGFLVSMLRYRLYDAETAITRSAAYAVLTAALVGTFAGTEALIEHLGQLYLGMEFGDAAAAMAAAIAAVLLTPLHTRISMWAEQRFQRDLAALKRDLPELLDHLALSSAPAELAEAVLARIDQAIHATSAAVIVNGSVIARLDRHAAQPSGEPLTLDIACAACTDSVSLVLGSRPDGSRHASDEVAAVKSILPAFRHALDATIALQALRTDIRRAQADIDSIRNKGCA